MNFVCPKCNGLLNGANYVLDREACACEYQTMTSSSDAGSVLFNQIMNEIKDERPITLKQNLPPIYGKICIHHNDAERKDIKCPVCLREKLKAAMNSILNLEDQIKIERAKYKELEEDYYYD